MANLIQIKRSTTATNTPTLSEGELGINLVDKRLFSANATVVFDAVQNTASSFSITGDTQFLFVGNSTVNVSLNSTSLVFEGESSSLGGITHTDVDELTVTGNVVFSGNVWFSDLVRFNPQPLSVGSDTVNAVITSAQLKVMNSTSNSTFSIPTAAQWTGGNFYLNANGSWVSPAGSGDVTKVGVPADSQVGVWTGDGTIEGDTALTFDTTTDILTVGGDTASVYIGNSTINAVVTSTSVKVMNSTSNSTFAIPTAAQWTDGGYFLNANGSWVTAGGGSSVTVQEAAPGSPSEGDLWWASGTNDGVLRVYYDDGVDALWVDAVPQLPGATGDTGPTGPAGDDGIPYAYSSTTADADPGAGILRLNNATLSSATAIYIDDVDDDGTNIEAELLSWDDVTNATSRGKVILKRVSDGSKVVFDITGASTDASGYVKLAVTYSDGATGFTDTDALVVQFAAAGNDGTDGVVSPKSLTLLDPVNTDDVVIYHTDTAITISQIRTLVRGTTPSVTATFKYSTDRNAAGTTIQAGIITTNVTVGNIQSSFTDATVVANSWIWVEVTAISGTVDEYNTKITFS